MKTLLMFCVVMLGPFAKADAYRCGAEGLKDPEAQMAYQFLKSIEGKFKIGSCTVELHMCDAQAPHEEGSSTVGDIGVTDIFGHFFYVPFDFSLVATRRVEKVIKNGRRMVHYSYYDKIPDRRHGKKEFYTIEIVKSRDLSRIEYLDFGIYNSRIRERYPNLPRGESYWINCGASEEY